jgi:hypothetical protein
LHTRSKPEIFSFSPEYFPSKDYFASIKRENGNVFRNILFLSNDSLINKMEQDPANMPLIFDESKYKLRTWKYPLKLLWMLNPMIIINDLFLGQRVPAISFSHRKTGKPSLVAKTVIPCPHCHHLHPGFKWAAINNNAFFNWFGLYCDQCGKTIPCIRNLFALLITWLTFPLWIGFRKMARNKWLNCQPQRFVNLKPPNPENTFAGQGRIMGGLFWGWWMFICMIIIEPLIYEEVYTLRRASFFLAYWLVMGIGFGYLMNYVEEQKLKKAAKKQASNPITKSE